MLVLVWSGNAINTQNRPLCFDGKMDRSDVAMRKTKKSLVIICFFLLFLLVFVKFYEYKGIADKLNKYKNNEDVYVEFSRGLLNSDQFNDLDFNTDMIYGFEQIKDHIDVDYNDSDTREIFELLDKDTGISLYKDDEYGLKTVVFKEKVKILSLNLGHLWVYYGDEELFPNCPDNTSQYRIIIKFSENLYYDYESNLCGFVLERPLLDNDNFIINE